MDQRLAVLMCGLMCFGIEAQDAPKIEPCFDPITVALRRDVLRFHFTIFVPKNQSLELFQCSHTKSGKKILKHRSEILTDTDKFVNIVILPINNSSDSGEYFCSYKNTYVYWMVLVRDEGYREPDPDNSVFICIGSLAAGLFLFSVIGSTVLCKDYRCCPKDSENNEEGMEGNRKVKDESIEDSANDGSVYMGLQPSTSSIYNVIGSVSPAKETKQKKEAQSATKETSKMQKTQKEEDIIESVYENY
nr:uncharacterized protein LOC111841746 [Paramormyrops kingsleyae]